MRLDQGVRGIGKAWWVGRLRDLLHCVGGRWRIGGHRSHRQKMLLHCQGLRRESGLAKVASILLIDCRNAGLRPIARENLDVCGAGE